MSNEKQRLPIDAIQLAVYTRLSTDLATPWPSVGVFSWQVPKGEEYPFVVIGMFSGHSGNRGLRPEYKRRAFELHHELYPHGSE